MGLSVLAATEQFRPSNLQNASLADLERQIVDCKDATTWCAYGDKLQAANRFADSTKAYEKALLLQPDLVDARINIALALAQAKNADAFFSYFSKLTSSYPKLAFDLLDRPQLSAMKIDPRWEPAAAAARAQAVD